MRDSAAGPVPPPVLKADESCPMLAVAAEEKAPVAPTAAATPLPMAVAIELKMVAITEIPTAVASTLAMTSLALRAASTVRASGPCESRASTWMESGVSTQLFELQAQSARSVGSDLHYENAALSRTPRRGLHLADPMSFEEYPERCRTRPGPVVSIRCATSANARMLYNKDQMKRP
eukprot:1270665-Rhodomonas_salina.1